jgi:nitrogen fixation NifU-like protein
MAIGLSLEDAAKIDKQDVVDALDGLPALKMHCSNLAAEALQAAIADYKEKLGISAS